VNIKDEVEIVGKKRQCEGDEYKRQDKKLMPYGHIFVDYQALAPGHYKKAKDVLSEKIEAKKLKRVLFVTEGQPKAKKG
jgi:hypothetical protein